MIKIKGRKEERTSEEALGYFGAKRMEFLMNNFGEVYERAFLDGALETHCRRIQKQAEEEHEALVKEISKGKPDETEEIDKIAEALVLKKMVFTL